MTSRFTRWGIFASLISHVALSVAAIADEPTNCADKAITEKQAKQGDTDAETQMGFMYFNGLCVEKDNAKARAFLVHPAEQGNTKAMALLATSYHSDGWDNEAAEWARKAADLGGRGGQSILGWLYYLGKGVPRDYGQALFWAQRAADQNTGGGMTLLGLLYQNGEAGLPKDYTEADKWFILGNRIEPTNKTLTFAKKVLEASMSEKDRQEAQKKADIWHPKGSRRD